jgi:DMSO/TMAO reductase YedYZ molybdopterin-dependent catalytic subunit
MSPISRGFGGRRRDDVDPSRIPPGQYSERGFPVLSAGPTPRTPLEEWTFSIQGAVDEAHSWTWDEFTALPAEDVTVDIHCVTKWSKLDTRWKGVSVDTLLDGVETEADWVTAFADGDYTTNLGLEDVTDGRAWIAYEYDGAPLDPEHGGPARLLVPHLYFWKSAKWVRGLALTPQDEPGFWEGYGYHNHGDPWKEQRYSND